MRSVPLLGKYKCKLFLKLSYKIKTVKIERGEMDMKLITFDDIQNLCISPKLCYEWTNEMILNKKEALLPAKISMKPNEGIFCNVMPCILPQSNDGSLWGGVKIVNRYPERNPSLDSRLLLLDMKTGEFLALMDANWITAMRTGAAAAHSILLLGKQNFTTVGIMGLGNTARATLLVLADMMPDREIVVKLLKYKGQEEQFVERFSNYRNIKFIIVDDNEALVKGSDIILSCITYSEQDLCSDECFKEGVLVVPIHTRGFTNCDVFFDKVYADDYGHVKHFKNFGKFQSFAEICDVVNGVAAGRENDNERIIVYNIGISIHDINFAAHIYQLLKEDKNLINIEMHSPTRKFWI